jgi:hypothetical protein
MFSNSLARCSLSLKWQLNHMPEGGAPARGFGQELAPNRKILLLFRFHSGISEKMFGDALFPFKRTVA